MALPEDDHGNAHYGAHGSSDEGANNEGETFARSRYSWPENWSRKESQFTGSYVIWKNHYGLKEKEWEKVAYCAMRRITFLCTVVYTSSDTRVIMLYRYRR